MKQIQWFTAEHAPKFMVLCKLGYRQVREPAETAEDLRRLVERLDNVAGYRPCYSLEYLQAHGVVHGLPDFCDQCGSLGADLNGLCHTCAENWDEAAEEEWLRAEEHEMYFGQNGDPLLGW